LAKKRKVEKISLVLEGAGEKKRSQVFTDHSKKAGILSFISFCKAKLTNDP
jgi:hypothetical protein